LQGPLLLVTRLAGVQNASMVTAAYTAEDIVQGRRYGNVADSSGFGRSPAGCITGAAAEPVGTGMLSTPSAKADYSGEEVRDGFEFAIDKDNGRPGGIAT